MSIDARALAGVLAEATRTGEAVPQLSISTPLTVDDAYAVQQAGIALLAERGDEQVGVKLGLTSKAKAAQMGVADVIIGVLTASMQIADGGTIDISHGVHPRVEPEVAFLIGDDVPADASDADVLTAVTHVAPALEIIDSRYKDFRFTLEDVVADNTSASGFVVGPWVPVDPLHGRSAIADVPVRLIVDGEEAAVGSTADILGNPWQAPLDARRLGARYGHRLSRGTILLAGAATAAASLAGCAEVRAEVAGLGEVSVRIEEE